MRCDGAGPDSSSPQPVTARASSLRTAISQRDRSTDVPSGHGAPAAATMIAPAAFHDPAAARVAAAARPGYQGLSDASGASGRHREWMRSAASTTTPTRQMSPARARAVPRCVRAVARTEISVLLSASFPLCLASLDRLSQLSTATREQVRAWSPPRVLSARAEKGTLQHLQVAVPMARTLPLASSLLTTTTASCLRPDLARSPRRPESPSNRAVDR